ncbi:3' terminal RNA ribose 2'-O-methyltransferase Hen1 [Peribacillus muralis]|uniref:3' terminal RNA ribose 2'-O-methyltransferase Hen1 n=1 Tax=Peribacillus muralis TaxID=264697 RepID=UPI001F4F10C2|nr:3' terminal RNA ribose 2'-O-methyltransferase Hen1 [Peribacillus muralis]MCK1992095.1 3' terminal RNA ribose 2'-O-methyltransferase Hen1 [Peribacillus muralis]MCK2012651.1 3' terminal RNA ribose 2'-O-methyltransferase Hen1 [Peribacillus muralis]
MQLTINASGNNVKAISYLLSKNPNNLYERKHKGHVVRLFYSTFTETEMEATIFVTPDPIELVKNTANSYDITHYINDREFAVSSIFCSLIRSALGTALNGQPKEEHAEWVNHPFSFQFDFGPVVSTLSDNQLRELFEPIGYEVSITRPDIQYSFDMKDRSSTRTVSLKGLKTLQEGLRHLFVLIPVIDNYKHYYIDEKEIDKLERYGEGWLDDHPMRDFIYRQSLRFKEVYSIVENKKPEMKKDDKESKVRLNDLRYEKIFDTVSQMHPSSVVDFGSGEGKLSVRLGFIEGVKEILAVEPSQSATLKALGRFDKVKDKEKFVIPKPLWGSLFYYDEELKNKDVIILCEVIEHIDEHRLPKVMDTILQDYQPRALILTTPNREYNEVYDMEDALRHNDHRFEWTRAEFQQWCTARNHDDSYDLRFEGIGEEHVTQGCPTQMCVFERKVD